MNTIIFKKSINTNPLLIGYTMPYGVDLDFNIPNVHFRVANLNSKKNMHSSALVPISTFFTPYGGKEGAASRLKKITKKREATLTEGRGQRASRGKGVKKVYWKKLLNLAYTKDNLL